jgi:hypothetical protein
VPLSSRRSECPRQPLTAADSPTKLDVVVLFTTDFLTESALFAARRLADELDALIRLVRIEDVPYPLPLDLPRISAEFLQNGMVPLASRHGAHVQICFARNTFEGMLYLLSKKSVLVMAARRRWFRFLHATREECLARTLQSRGYSVLVEYVPHRGDDNA